MFLWFHLFITEFEILFQNNDQIPFVTEEFWCLVSSFDQETLLHQFHKRNFVMK